MRLPMASPLQTDIEEIYHLQSYDSAKKVCLI